MSIKTYKPEDNPFKIIYVDITHRCQMNCANCYLPNRTIADMDIQKLTNLIRRLPKKTDLRLIGGEPTLRSDLNEIVEMIKFHGHRPLLITNGLKLSNFEYVQSLKKSGLDYLQLSLNGYDDDEIYKKIDNMECASLKMQALNNCIKSDISASLSCIIVRDVNEHLVGKLIDAALSLPKPVRINFRNVGDIGRNTSKQISPLSLVELSTLVANKFSIKADEVLSCRQTSNQIIFRKKIGPKFSDKITIKITDWTIFQEEKLIDPKSSIRGRVTQDFELASHFEHVKENEFGY